MNHNGPSKKTVAAEVANPNLLSDGTAKQEFLWHTHGYLNEYARFADTKAAFSGTLAAAFLGYLYSTRIFAPLVKTSCVHWPITGWITAAAGLSLVASIGLAISTIRPRLRTSQSKGYIYWGSIASQDFDSFRARFYSESATSLNDHLLKHVFDISKFVCIPKYRNVSLCMLMLTLGALLGASSLLLRDIWP